MTSQLDAFLDMLGVSEGTVGTPGSDNGYNVLVGSTFARPSLFHSYADHPRIRVPFKKKDGSMSVSTAAGKYQILARYFEHYQGELKLPDFGPSSQDAIAVQLIRECRALDDIEAGRITLAIKKCRSRWASLPGAGYGQHEHEIETLLAAFVKHGGVLAC